MSSKSNAIFLTPLLVAFACFAIAGAAPFNWYTISTISPFEYFAGITPAKVHDQEPNDSQSTESTTIVPYENAAVLNGTTTYYSAAAAIPDKPSNLNATANNGSAVEIVDVTPVQEFNSVVNESATVSKNINNTTAAAAEYATYAPETNSTAVNGSESAVPVGTDTGANVTDAVSDSHSNVTTVNGSAVVVPDHQAPNSTTDGTATAVETNSTAVNCSTVVVSDPSWNSTTVNGFAIVVPDPSPDSTTVNGTAVVVPDPVSNSTIGDSAAAVETNPTTTVTGPVAVVQQPNSTVDGQRYNSTTGNGTADSTAYRPDLNCTVDCAAYSVQNKSNNTNVGVVYSKLFTIVAEYKPEAPNIFGANASAVGEQYAELQLGSEETNDTATTTVSPAEVKNLTAAEPPSKELY